MTLRTEIGMLSIAAGFAVGVFATVPSPFDLTAPEVTDSFESSDFDAFDRNFELAGTECAVGVQSKGLCFNASPLESQLTVGAPLPAFVPDMPASMDILVATNLKTEGLQTQRFGQSLILVDTQTRTIVDHLSLGEALYTEQPSGEQAGI